MRTTRDTFTGKPFRWNTIVYFKDKNGNNGQWVPARVTAKTSIWLHPDRVPAGLLAELNKAA